jgi:TRAP-type C4-dicarboxylate transport system permease large subunit
VIVVERMITPPVGLNLFIINSIARDIAMSDTMQGVLPFLIADVFRGGAALHLPAESSSGSSGSSLTATRPLR